MVLFAVPGAFTPTCDAKHLPGFVQLADQIKAKGVDTIACMAVNDVFVMDAWGKASNVGDKILMLADGNGDYARALGPGAGWQWLRHGERGQRFAIIVEDGVAKQVFVEAPGSSKSPPPSTSWRRSSRAAGSSSGTIWNRSPTRPMSATSKIGASASLLMATMVRASLMPVSAGWRRRCRSRCTAPAR